MLNKTNGIHSRWKLVALVIGLVLAMQTGATAQEATGKILGTVKDPAGAVIPGAKVTVINTATHQSRETTTDQDGFYQALSLPIGTYRVTVEQGGFRKVTTEEQPLRINQVLRMDIQMELGSPAEVLEITAQAAGVETVNNTLGQSVTSRPLVNLPLNGRNVLQLALLQPGVTETNPISATANSPGQFSVAGGRADSVTFLLDGGVNNNLLSNLVVFNPNPDTVEEFRILTSNYSSEYGRNAGGIVSVVLKSGTNVLHGSVFEFLRNEALNANTFFRNRDGLPIEILKRNQFGFTNGGPITIPKVVNGENRFFYFFGYQGQRLVQNRTNPAVTVFTPAELAGDFSLSNSTRTGPDSGVVSFLQRFPFYQPDPAKAAQGIIDPSRLSSVARNYIRNGLIPTSSTGQLIPTGGAKDNYNEVSTKVDLSVTRDDKITVTLGLLRNPTLVPFTAESNAAGFPITTQNHRYFANIAYMRTFSPTLLNEFRFTAQRHNNFQNVPARSLPKPNELGIGINSDNPTGPTQLSFASGLTLGFSRNGPTDLVDNTFAFSDTASWIKGKHDFKFGGTYSPYQDNTVFDFFINGRFRFRGTKFTSNGFADFLLGLPNDYLQFPEAPSDIRTKSVYVFAQDEWHVRRNLTLSYGIRYEYSQPKFDTRGRSFSLSLGQQSTRFRNAPLGLLFPDDPGAPKGANFSDRNDWGPRFGFAWDPWSNGKTSIRGGFGVYYDILKGEDNLQFNGQAPFFGFASLPFPALAANPSGEVRYLTQPFEAINRPNPFPSRPPAPDINFRAQGFLPFGDAGVYFVDPHLRTPYIYQYSLSIQRELIPDLIMETSYVGSSSHKLTNLVDANPFILGDPRIVRLFNAQPGVAPDAFSYMYEFRNAVNANYNSLQFSVQKRLSESHFFGTGYFTFAYTYSHSIDDGSGFRERNSLVPYYNSKQFRASADYDVRHRITFSGGWDLPFGRGWSSGVKQLVNGWSIYPIVTWRTGFPLDVFAGGNFVTDMDRPGPSGQGDASSVRVNLAGNSVGVFDPRNSQTFNNRTGNFYFAPSNFTTAGLDPDGRAAVTNPALRTYGSLPRNAFRAPNRAVVDFAVAKTTPIIGERLKLEFRAEFFNIFNRVNFEFPSTNINSNLFGQITSTGDPRIIQFGLRFKY